MFIEISEKLIHKIRATRANVDPSNFACIGTVCDLYNQISWLAHYLATFMVIWLCLVQI